jgi:hypothetical protein
LLYIVAYVLGLTNTAASPFGGILGEIWGMSVFGYKLNEWTVECVGRERGKRAMKGGKGK